MRRPSKSLGSLVESLNSRLPTIASPGSTGRTREYTRETTLETISYEE